MPSIARAAEPVHPLAEESLTFRNLHRFVRETGLTAYRAKTLAVCGRVRTRVRPGSKPEYAVEDGLAVVRGER
jgi:hypothetical protein